MLLFFYFLPLKADSVTNYGCFRDTGNRAIPTIEGSDPVLDGNYKVRRNAISKCAVATLQKSYGVFAVQDGGWCAAAKTAGNTFDKYGKSDACNNDGKGGGLANNVYLIGKKVKSVKQAVCRFCWNVIVRVIEIFWTIVDD